MIDRILIGNLNWLSELAVCLVLDRLSWLTGVKANLALTQCQFNQLILTIAPIIIAPAVYETSTSLCPNLACKCSPDPVGWFALSGCDGISTDLNAAAQRAIALSFAGDEH